MSYAAPQTSAKEYQIKAVYLSKLIHFITWPTIAFSSVDAPYQLCILGEDPFKHNIDIVFRDRKIKNRSVIIKRLSQTSTTDRCHILFVAASHLRQVSFIVDNVHNKKKHTLTVSDMPAFIRQGGMIELYSNRKRQVRLAIDPETLLEAKLKVSANLLRISRTAGGN
ncbi:MAG: YfiR family protein [Proteobacteria bacterium]|nr:YfiR family protein [Pseudomonadota bacterium]